MKKIIAKFVLLTLVAAFIAAPFQLNAQVGGTSVPIVQQGETDLGPIGGAIVGEAAGALNAAVNSCATADTIASQSASFLSQGLSLLGESPAQAAGIQSQITVVDSAIACWTGVITAAGTLSKAAGSAAFTYTKVNSSKEQALAQIVSLKSTRKQLEARLQVASQSFWKAVLVGLFLKQTDQLTEKLVTDMTEKFKINDYSQYISAVSDTVYTNSMILRYVDNDKDRAIVRSMITNPLLRNGIHPAIQASADAYVGYSPSNISFSDPQFLNAVNKVANGEVYKQQYQSSMISKTDEIIAKARQAAVAEVNQSGGYKSTLNNCGPTLSAQQQKDAQYKAILDEIADRENLHESIHALPNSSDSEKNTIDTDVKNAKTKLAKVTDSFGQAVVHICEGTNTPALKFKDTIHDLIGSQIKNFTDYNDNNLPIFQKLIIDLADNLVNKFVFGKNSASTGEMINESVASVATGVAASLSKPSSTIGTPPYAPPGTTTPSTTTTSGQGSGTPGNVAGVETRAPSMVVMPRGPTPGFR